MANVTTTRSTGMAIISAVGRFDDPDQTRALCAAVHADPIGMAVVVDLTGVESMCQRCVLELADHLRWRLVWSPVGVVVRDPHVRDELVARYLDRLAVIGDDLGCVLRGVEMWGHDRAPVEATPDAVPGAAPRHRSICDHPERGALVGSARSAW